MVPSSTSRSQGFGEFVSLASPLVATGHSGCLNVVAINGFAQVQEHHRMPTLVIDNVPASLYHRIQSLAKTRQRTATDTVLEVLETAFPSATPALSGASELHELFLTNEIYPPCEIPWPVGEAVVPIECAASVPEPHDFSETE